MNWLELPAVKWALPIPLLIVVAPVVWLFFRGTWRELDAEALALRRDLAARGEIDYRPMVALTLVAFILTFQEYYGRPDFYMRVDPRPDRPRTRSAHPGSVFDLAALRRALHARLVGADAHRRLPAAARGLAALLPPRHAARLRAARARLPRARLDLRAVRGGDDAGAADRQPCSPTSPTTTRCTSRRAGRGSTSSLWEVALPRAVLHAGDVLPRLLAARDAQLRRGRHLVDGRPLLHDPLRQAVPGGVRRR